VKKILTPILLIVGIFAGVFGANFLKGSPAEPAAVESEEYADGEHASDEHGKDGKSADGKTDKKKTDKDKKDKKDKGKADKSKDGYGGSVSAINYYKFSREFIIPLMDDSEIKSLVILNINLEFDVEKSPSLFAIEPKLRDNIMTTLIELSNDGVTLDKIGNIESYETVRSMVLKNLQEVIGEGITNVLIVDMAKQDV